jgi:hypothetical protein
MFSEGVPLLAEHGVAIYAGEAQTPAWAESQRSLRELLTGFIEPPQPPHYLALLVWLMPYADPPLYTIQILAFFLLTHDLMSRASTRSRGHLWPEQAGGYFVLPAA